MLTLNGRIRLCRIRWHEPGQGSTAPLDRVLDEAERSISEGVRELACRLNRGVTGFKQTAENLNRAAHLEISKETLRQLIEAEGRQVLRAQQDGALSPGWKAAECTVASGLSRVYLGCDGVMVPLVTDVEKQKRRAAVKQKRQQRGRRCRPLPPRKTGADQAYKEFKLAVLYDEEQSRRYANATSGDHAAAGRLLRRMATQVSLAAAAEKVALIDGAPWIRNEIELHGLVDALGLDYYHVRENVQRAALAVYGAESEEAQKLRETVMGLFAEQGYEAGWNQLLTWRSALRGKKRAAVDRLLGYLAERREMIRYPAFRARGWQIGSGPTEAQCKTATSRLKGHGRRWDKSNAEALMALECLEQSHAWPLYWTTLSPPST